MACARAYVSDNRKLHVQNLEESHIEGLLHLQWQQILVKKIFGNLLKI